MATAKKATTTAAESNGLPTITESATEIVRQATGVGRAESEYTKAVRSFVETAKASGKTYRTSFKYGPKEGELSKDAQKFVSAVQRVSKALDVSVLWGSDHKEGKKLPGTTLCFVTTKRITRTRKATAKATATA